MRFALVNQQRQEPKPGLSGNCPICAQPMIAKCGEFKIWHWAHRGKRHCDTWWENETEWHRAWKGKFPADWQEIVHTAEDGKKHVADVKTGHGWVLEFQHSPIKPEERQSRENFYKKLVWVVDGTRLKRDKEQFYKAFKSGSNVPVAWVCKVDVSESVLLRKWLYNQTLVFFDFGDEDLWWLFGSASSWQAYVTNIKRSDFVNLHRGHGALDYGDFDELVSAVSVLLKAPPPTLAPQPASLRRVTLLRRVNRKFRF